MDEYNIELPEMDRPIKIKTLKDLTNICTCRLPGINKYGLVLDTGVETVLYFHFEKRMELLLVSSYCILYYLAVSDK